MTAGLHGAYADGDPKLADADARKVEGDRLLDLGIKMAREHKDREQVLATFESAYKLNSSPEALFNLASAEATSLKHHEVEALRNFRFYLEGPHDTNDEPVAKQKIAELFAKTGHFKIRGPVPAAVTVDGQDAVLSGDAYDVLVGHHIIEARTQTVRQIWEYTFRAAEVKALDYDGPVPPSMHPLPPSGEHPVAATSAEGGDKGGPTASKGPAPAGSDVRAEPDQGGTHPHEGKARVGWTIGLEAAAVATVVVGAVVRVSAATNLSNANGLVASSPSYGCAYQNPTPSCAQALSDAQAHTRNVNIATGMFVGAGALAAAGAVVWFWPRKTNAPADANPAAGVAVIPSIAPGFGGALISGQF